MKLIAGSLNGEYLDELLENAIEKTESVKAAVAYPTHDPKLFRFCRENDIKLTFWGRYDGDVPVATSILKKFLDKRSPNYICKLVPDIFHAKIIWWEGYGVYIGSANLTDRAWGGNIEAGLFLTEDEIIENELEESLNNFFDELDTRSHPLTSEIYNELYRLEKSSPEIYQLLKNQKDQFNKDRIIPLLNPLAFIAKASSYEKRKNIFLLEWKDTLQILRDIADRVSDKQYRPNWISPNVPKGVQADQFLHAYYYSQVKNGNKSLHRQHYETNKNNPEKALVNAMNWWKSLSSSPHGEDITIREWATYLSDKLDRSLLLSLTENEFIEVCKKIHALQDHSLRVKYTTFGASSPLHKMNKDERINLLGKWLFNQVSRENKTVLETIYYLLYGGDAEKTPERLWEVTSSDKWKISHLGISSLGEIVGWAMPDTFPPRNGRTSKALTSLGFKVRIHSE